MCTVTYIPSARKNQFILTSNRDEKSYRKTLPLDNYDFDGINLYYPKDVQSGGSWIAMNNKGRIVCLLNGGFIAHCAEQFHTHSRGKVLLDLAKTDETACDFINHYNLKSTEPFTILTIDYENEIIKSFSEIIWDGIDIHYRDLDTEQPQIWSSVTLYSAENRKLRKKWFKQFLQNQKNISESDILKFHTEKRSSNPEVDLVMEREDEIKTVSITQIVANGRINMTYWDLQNKTTHKQSI